MASSSKRHKADDDAVETEEQLRETGEESMEVAEGLREDQPEEARQVGEVQHAELHTLDEYSKTVDSDIVVLAISEYSELQCEELWIAFGVGKHFKVIPVHILHTQLGTPKATALPLFHALTGCDTVSSFLGKGKTTAFNTWTKYPELSESLNSIRTSKGESLNEEFMAIERFIVLMYSSSSDSSSVNSERQALFTRGRAIDQIPPTADALMQHLLRAVFQGVHVWSQSLIKHQLLPCPSDWGWKKDKDQWKPLWITLPQSQQACRELIHCSCKKNCSGKCSCFSAGLPCTHLCSCICRKKEEVESDNSDLESDTEVSSESEDSLDFSNRFHQME